MHVTQFLSKARFRSTEFGLVVCGAPWSGRLPPLPRAVIFALREGACWLVVDGQAPIRMHAGDVALVPRGASHRLCSDLDAPDEPVAELIRKRPIETYMIRHGGDGPRTVFCAAVGAWDDVARATVARILPEVLVVRREEFGRDSETETITALLEREARKAREACPVIAHRLLNLLLAEILFARFNEPALRAALAKSFAKPQIARALMLIHASLATDWTATHLAERVGLSRSAFTVEFRAVMGMPPGRYITLHRLDSAASLLTSTPYDVATIADLVGYASVPSFIKAFKRRFAMSPGQYRAEARMSTRMAERPSLRDPWAAE